MKWHQRRKRHHFRAYDARGTLMTATWTSSPVTYTAECAAYQEALDSGLYADVQISSTDPNEPIQSLRRTLKGRAVR